MVTAWFLRWLDGCIGWLSKGIGWKNRWIVLTCFVFLAVCIASFLPNHLSFPLTTTHCIPLYRYIHNLSLWGPKNTLNIKNAVGIDPVTVYSIRVNIHPIRGKTGHGITGSVVIGSGIHRTCHCTNIEWLHSIFCNNVTRKLALSNPRMNVPFPFYVSSLWDQ